MSNNTTGQEPPLLRVSSPPELLAAVPYLFGFHPADSLVVLGLADQPTRVNFSCRVDLPESGAGTEVEELVAEIVNLVGGQRVSAVLLVAYGARERADATLALAEAEFGNRGIDVREVLRAEGGRYWSYCCHDPVCCPPRGTPYDVTSSSVAASATVAGLVALPDRAAVERSVAPVEGAASEAMHQAHARVRARLEEWSRECGDAESLRTKMTAEGKRRVGAALARYRDGGDRLDDDEIAMLAALLVLYPVRDDAWLRIERGLLAAHLALWTDVVRRTEEIYVPAPASLLSFAAWQDGNGTLASIAVDRALRAQPSYTMAHLIAKVLAAGMPPAAWPPVAARREELGRGGTDPCSGNEEPGRHTKPRTPRARSRPGRAGAGERGSHGSSRQVYVDPREG